MENKIENFTKIRADGKIIPDQEDFNIFKLGWEPCKIVAVYWNYNGRRVEFHDDSETGIRLDYVKELNMIVFLKSLNTEPNPCFMTVYNADGSIRFRIPNVQKIRGIEREGKFLWLVDYTDEYPGHYGVVFQVDDYNAMYNILFDLETGETEFLSEAR